MRATPRLRAPELAERLRGRRSELEKALLARVRSVAEPSEVGDPDYVRSLREAVGAALEFAIGALDRLPQGEEPIPPQLAAQARLAARRSVGLDTVLRRYVAGHALFYDFLLDEAGEVSASSLASALRAEGLLLDRVLAEVSAAYANEREQGHRGADRRRAMQVRRLLAGGLEDPSELGYDLDLWHLGVIALGPGAAATLRELAAAFDRRLLVAAPGGGELWAWLGGRRVLAAAELAEHAKSEAPRDLALAIGEPGRGPSAWRLTHRQARLALPVARCEEGKVVAYSEVVLLASLLADETLAESLTTLYIAPFEAERDGGVALRETLRAYFAAGRNVSSAAAALGVSRQTAASRLGAVEERIGRPLEACGAELEIALRLWDLGGAGTVRVGSSPPGA